MLETHHRGQSGREGITGGWRGGWSGKKVPINHVWGQERGEGTLKQLSPSLHTEMLGVNSWYVVIY